MRSSRDSLTASQRGRPIERILRVTQSFGAAMASRAGEPDKMRFRGSHVFPAHGKWYFNTREGIDVGPFDTRSDAEINSTRLRLVLAKITDKDLARTVIQR